MSRGLKVLLIVGLPVLAILGAGYFLMTPHHRLGTRTELEKVVDPRLLVPLPQDPEAENRFRELAQIGDNAENQHQLVRPLGLQSLIRSNQKKIRDILAQGPLREPMDATPLSHMESRGMDNLLYLLTHADEATSAKEAVDIIEMTLMLVDRLRGGVRSATLAEMMVAHVESEQCETALRYAIWPDMPLDQSQRLVDAIPPDDCQGSTFEELAAWEMQASLEWMQDPFKYPKVYDSTFIRQGTDLKRETEKIDRALWTGNYDAVETAKLYSDCLIATLDKKDLPEVVKQIHATAYPVESVAVPHRPASIYGVNFMTASTDEYDLFPPYLEQKGLERTKSEMAFTWKRNRHPNSVGVALIAMAGNGAVGSPVIQPKGTRNVARVAVAMNLYWRKHGTYPPNIQTLVKEGILKNIPVDCFSKKPIQYDSKNKVVWSVGKNNLKAPPPYPTIWSYVEPAMVISQMPREDDVR